ncbi:MAG: hypothetical protein K2N01_05270 [Lachnospiraceae bacterium]|nr:hypothetical protein [Lachnospiraceae bacterium]
MKKACSVLGSLVLIIGIIGSIVLAWSNGVVVSYSSYYGIKEERSMLLTFAWFAAGILMTAVGSVILMSLGEMIENQESIAYRVSEIESKLSLVEKKDKEADELRYSGSWKCEKCGRVNANHTGTCACGQTRGPL